MKSLQTLIISAAFLTATGVASATTAASTTTTTTATTTPTTMTVHKAEKKMLVVDVNKATVKELEKVHGLHKHHLAKKIVEYREKNGNFTSLEDLMKVKGMTEKTFNKVKAHLSV